MSDLTPFIHQQEVTKIKNEIAGRKVSVIFDGTTRLGEAMAIVLRFIDDEWNIQHRLIRLQLLENSLTGEEITSELISVLQLNYSIGIKALTTVNNVAIATVKVLYPGCFSHTTDHVGEHYFTTMLDEFISAWIFFPTVRKQGLLGVLEQAIPSKLTPKQDGEVTGSLSIMLWKYSVIFRPFLRRMNWEHLPVVDCLQSCRILTRRSTSS